MAPQRILLGAAWPYASGPRHLGHLAGVYLPADVVARASRLAGHEVLFVSGSDQYGTPITVAAERAAVSPRQLAETNHEAITRTFAAAGITFDHYAATATPTHHRVVHEVFDRLHRRGLVHAVEREGAWCPQHRRSLPDRYLVGACPHCGAPEARGDQCDDCGATLEPSDLLDPRCRTCDTRAELRLVPQLVLDLPGLAFGLDAWLRTSRRGWSRPWVGEEAAGHLAGGLRRRDISRDLQWGVPVPLAGWEEHRFYVWFDAVIGYLSATVEWAEVRGEPERWRQWWIEGVEQGGLSPLRHRYFVGKDNVWFHTVWWPAILLGAAPEEGALHLPDDVVASHHLTLSGAQLSSSRSHGTTLDDALERWGADAVRHAAAAAAPEQADSELSDAGIADLTRSGLLGAIANPAHRVTTLWWRRFGLRPPSAAGDAAWQEQRAATQPLVDAVAEHLQAGRLRRGLEEIHALGRSINRRLAAEEPWRAPADQAEDGLRRLLADLDALALSAWPIVPATAQRIRTTLGREAEPTDWSLPATPPRIAVAPEPPLQRGRT